MWFSSGGTNSVVHTDSFDNMNCLLRGNKTLVLVDPSLYKYQVRLRVFNLMSLFPSLDIILMQLKQTTLENLIIAKDFFFYNELFPLLPQSFQLFSINKSLSLEILHIFASKLSKLSVADLFYVGKG